MPPRPAGFKLNGLVQSKCSLHRCLLQLLTLTPWYKHKAGERAERMKSSSPPKSLRWVLQVSCQGLQTSPADSEASPPQPLFPYQAFEMCYTPSRDLIFQIEFNKVAQLRFELAILLPQPPSRQPPRCLLKFLKSRDIFSSRSPRASSNWPRSADFRSVGLRAATPGGARGL